jgi:hypothetical protein
MEDLEDILRIARDAFDEHPFYRWFYGERRGVDVHDIEDWRDVPVVSRQDFFDYQDATGRQ